MSRVLVLGSSNMDLVMNCRALPAPGETVIGTGFFRAHGGKGANQAVAAARAGARVAFVARLGDDDFGQSALEAYHKARIADDYIETVPDRPTGTALIFVDERGQNMIGVNPGANAALTREAAAALPDAAFAEARVFVAQLETPIDAVAEGLRRARRAGAVTILNPAPAPDAPLDGALLETVDLLVPNESEASRLSGVKVGDADSAREAAWKLIERGARCVILTMGERGCLVLDREEAVSRGQIIPGRSVEAVDAVAAGDAFVGALAARLAELAETGPPDAQAILDAARFATAAASIAVTRPGAQPSLPTREEIDAVIC